MANGSRKIQRASNEEVSIWFWMFAQFLIMMPLVNLIAVPVLAFVGQNRSRKNFFRALLMWLMVIVTLHVALLLLAISPAIFQWFKDLWGMLIEMVPSK